ncbi:baseplate J/gp47 family protein [Salmonella enterica]|nr:baseplate J/gp47 family protein [Salmonella enterica]EBG8070665.1 baseplate J/gp47 family protein [Salmonella enterica subsp. enterica serovar Elisabethville]EED8015244.1 baseplate J/gp47 family protein [Salmonella enterica subsp. enterica]EBH3514526.1 baseplate J/gp47 family protein [Salmonella enterica subsp. enterica serovar Elisabethville]EBH6160384.1 baseplate J/gp47 family protein [Salmonella enterica]
MTGDLIVYNPPTISTNIARIIADIDSRLTGAESAVKNRILNAIAYALGGGISGEYEELEWLAHQIIPHLSDDDFLLRWCAFFGVIRKGASAADGKISVTVAQATTIPKSTLFRRNDGTIYSTTEAVAAIAGGSVIVPAQATTTGTATNCTAGTAVSIVNPVEYVQAAAVVSASGMTGGSDVEPLAQLRQRLLFRVQYPPQGGTKWDYERWAREVPGVADAWCYPAESTPGGPGNVEVAFILDAEGDARFPTDADVERVDSYIRRHDDPLTNQPVGKPLGPILTTYGVIKKEVPFVIKLYPNTADVQQAVQEQIALLFADESRPDSTIYLSHVDQAISNTPGETDHELIEPAGNIYTARNELAVPGSYTWEQ